MAATPDEIIIRLRAELTDNVGLVVADAVAKANAGAALAYAMFYSPASFMTTLPNPVTRAYMAACKVFGLVGIDATSDWMREAVRLKPPIERLEAEQEALADEGRAELAAEAIGAPRYDEDRS